MTPTDAVRAFFAAYSEGHPEQFDQVVSPDDVDFGHTPPGRGPQGARDETVVVAWTGHLPNGSDFHGLSLYLIVEGLVAENRHAMIGPPPG